MKSEYVMDGGEGPETAAVSNRPTDLVCIMLCLKRRRSKGCVAAAQPLRLTTVNNHHVRVRNGELPAHAAISFPKTLPVPL